LKPRELAHETAIQGEPDAAVTQLSALLAGGEPAAAASLAEIEAFRGQWPEMLQHAYVFLRKPDSVYAGNVFTDITNLVALAGVKTGAWSEIQTQATAIRSHLLAKPGLKQYVDGSSRSASGMDQLIELAKSRGKSIYVWDWSNHNALDEDARAAKFEAGVAKMAARKNEFKNKAERVSAHFAYARNVGSHQSAIRLYGEEGTESLDSFDTIAFVASGLARAGRTKEAWPVVEQAFCHWWPVDIAQVAPVTLLTDEGLRPLMTPERCEWVLRTPRGPAAEQAKKTKKKS